MDCNQVNEAGVIESYLTGKLDPAQQEAFEQHYFECSRCFAALRTCRALQEELAASQETVLEEPLRERLPWRWGWAAGLALAGILLAVGLWREDGPPAPTVPPVATTPSPGAQPQPGTQPPATIPAAPSLTELAQIQPPRYAPVTLRGTTDEASRRFREAMQLYLKGDYRGAIPGLKAALELDPKADGPRFYLAACHLLIGQDDNAIGGLKATIALGDTPYLEDAHYYLAKAFLRKRNVTAASQQLKKMIELHGDREAEARKLLRKIEGLNSPTR